MPMIPAKIPKRIALTESLFIAGRTRISGCICVLLQRRNPLHVVSWLQILIASSDAAQNLQSTNTGLSLRSKLDGLSCHEATCPYEHTVLYPNDFREPFA